MGEKQEKRPAEARVGEVGPGVFRVQLPIRFTGLGHVNMYVIPDQAGCSVVDPGLPGRQSWVAIERGLEQIGLAPTAVHSIYVTHAHPDHFGGVPRLARASGADMIAHEAYRMWWRGPKGDEQVDPHQLEIERRARKGAHPWEDPANAQGWRRIKNSKGARNAVLGAMTAPSPTIRVQHGQELTLGDRPWQALHTPGHTGDHLCLYDPEFHLLLTGDHVLPTITPHVAGVGIPGDALGAYLSSLDTVAALDATALPAHGDPFDDVAGRTKEIGAHHDGRLEQIMDLAAEPRTAAQYAMEMYPERLWGYLADSETYAHLVHLETKGLLTRTSLSGAPRFVVTRN